MTNSLNPNASDVQKEIESILEDDEAYGSNVNILNWSSTPTKITGKFKDAWNNRVFDFTIDEDGVGYKPSVNLDSVPVENQEGRFDSFSDGYLSGIRADGKLTGKRTKKPKCGGTSFGCGFSCVGLTKVCRITVGRKKLTANQGSNISKERIGKLLAMASKPGVDPKFQAHYARTSTARTVAEQSGKRRSMMRNQETPNKKELEKEKKPDSILSNKDFQPVGDSETRKKLSQWIDSQQELEKAELDLYDDNPKLDIKLAVTHERLAAATNIIGAILKSKENKNALFGGIIDENGKLQAAYSYELSPDGYFVNLLASAPWNSLETHPDKKTGVGASAVESLIKDAINKKKKPQIELYPVSGAIPFYKKIGFKFGEMLDMKLNEEDARKFIKTQDESAKNRKDTKVITQNENLTELERLEEDALGLFTVPRGYIFNKLQKVR